MKVWVTRDEDVDGPLCIALRNSGMAPVVEPVVERRILDDGAQAIAGLDSDDWLVLTSPFAVKVVSRQPSRTPRVAVVAEPSRKLAEANGFRVELVSAEGSSRSLFDQLKRTFTGGRVCYPRSALAAPPQAWPGVELSSPVIYETVARSFDRTVIEAVDLVAVVSASAVVAIGPIDRPFASIGPSTSAALRGIGVEPAIESTERSFDSLAQAIRDYADASPHQRA